MSLGIRRSKWLLTKPLAIYIKELKDISLRLGPYINLHKGNLTIQTGYTSDGATWAPDFRRCLRGVIVHDALLQLREAYPGVFGEQVTHEIMYRLHREDRFAFAKIYYRAVSSWPRKLYKLVTQ